MMNRTAFEDSLLQPLSFWSGKSKAEVSALLGEEAAQMVHFDQRNPHHCYDLFLHTLYTVQFVDDSASAALRVAAFFHDIGKPWVAREKQGRLVFYGHAQKSAEIAGPLLSRLGYAQPDVDRICFYIGHHDDFISWVLPSEPYDHRNPYLIEITAQNVAAHIEKTAAETESLPGIKSFALWSELLLLVQADASAQAEYVYRNGAVIDSREHKVRKAKAIQAALKESFG
ncbi:MAG: HD domain-containing protein [Oscillospiraceae bacterium]|nr:HD domain-containing protein [Oscillospiraceae bacterium]